MSSSYQDWRRFTDSTIGLLDRFVKGGSVALCGHEIKEDEYDKKTKQRLFEFCVPNKKVAAEIRDKWSNDRRAMPKSGLIFLDGSILTVYIRAKTLPLDNLLKPIKHHVAINGEKGQIGFFEQYSYCFYPNSKAADKIGYFRYDFHADSMGDGGLGAHAYFHFHRRLDESFRHATGPVLDVGEVVSGIENVLSSKERLNRLKKTFNKGNFEELLMDLTVEGVEDFRKKYFAQTKGQWNSFRHKAAYEAFEEKYLL